MSIDDLHFFYTGELASSSKFLKANQFSDHSNVSQLLFSIRILSLKAFPYSKYLVLGERGPPSSTARLFIVNYSTIGSMTI